MKRSVLIILLSVLILLAGCRTPIPALNTAIEANVTVTGGAIDCTARVKSTADGVIFDILSPASVAGVSYTYSKGELRTSYGELSCITGSDSLPPSSVPMLVCETLSRLADAVYEDSGNEGESYRLRLSQGEVTVVCTGGVPHTITASYSPYTIRLTSNHVDA